MKNNFKKVLSSKMKAKVAIEAIRGEKTGSEIGSMYQIHPVTISKWKSEVEKRLHELFEKKKQKDDIQKDKYIEELEKKVGQLTVEVDWMKKKSGLFDS